MIAAKYEFNTDHPATRPPGFVGNYSASGCFSSPSFDRNSGCCRRDDAKRCVSRWDRSAKSSHFSASCKSRLLCLILDARFASSIELAALALYSVSLVMRAWG